MKRSLFLTFLILFSFSLARGDEQPQYDPNKIPIELEGIGVTEHLGQKVDLSLQFMNEDGKTVALGDYFKPGRPVMLFLVYYECPNLCTFVLNAAVESLKQIELNPGRDFEFVAISIDSRETPEIAAPKKKAYGELYGRPAFAGNLHFLTNVNDNAKKLADQIGFIYRWDKTQKQFAHASSFFILAPTGMISRYFYGIDYAAKDVRLSLIEASQNRIGNIIDKIVLFCFHYDSSAKKYILLATRIMAIGGALTLLVLGLFIAMFWYKDKKSKQLKGSR